MDNGEITQRVIGVLTETAEVRQLLVEDPERDDERIKDAADVVSVLAKELLSVEVEVPGDATPQEVAERLAAAMGPSVLRVMAAFTFAFSELAEVHDAGRTDVSSADVLRELALRAEDA
ncbi:hypothetical protein [Streptomyces parvulus]